MPLSMQSTKAQALSRLILIRLSSCMLRQMETWSRHLKDYDEAMIVLAVIVISAERLIRTELDPAMKDLSKPIATARLAKANVSSIAAAIGRNRETVRRRVARMVAAGVLARREHGGLYVSRDAAETQLHAQEVTAQQLEHFRRTANQLIEDGVFWWEPSLKKRQAK